MSKTYKGQITNSVVELTLQEEAVGAGFDTPTIAWDDTVNGVIKQVQGDIPDNWAFADKVKGPLEIGTSCTSIGSNAFYYCSGLTGDLVIPDSVTTIGSLAFYGCTGLTSDLVIGNIVTTIGDFAFALCNGLTGDLVIPDSVTSIGGFAFGVCSGLTALYTNTPAASWVGVNALQDTTALVNIYEGPDVTGQYSATFQGGSGMTVSAWTNYPNIP